MLVESDRRAIERLFEEKGNRWCRCQVETTENDGSTQLTFRVSLGEEIEVGQVDFVNLPEGARELQIDRELLMPPHKPYQPELLSFDEGTVTRKLQDLGWLDAKVTATRRELYDYVRPLDERHRHGPELAPDDLYNDRVVITYFIEAGRRYRLGKVSFVGNTVASQEQLRKAFAMPEGAWFIADDLYGEPREGGNKGAIERARRVISNQGYARCEMRADRHFEDGRPVVDLVLHVDEGRKYHVGRVDVSGNEKTRDAVVRRAMYLNPGDLWNDDRHDESVTQVRRTSVFQNTGPRPPQVETSYPADRPDEVDLTARVEEKSTATLNFQVGYSTASKIFGEVKYTENNFDLIGLLTSGFEHFRGAGQILESSVLWSETAKQITASWTDPHIFDGPYSLTVEGSRADDSLLSWSERRTSAGVNIGRYFLDNRLSLNLGYTYTDYKITNIQSNAPDDAMSENAYLQSLSLGESFDALRPDAHDPSGGFIISASQSLTGLALPSSAEFAEFTTKGDKFFPLATADDGGVTYIHMLAKWREEIPFGETAYMPFYLRYNDGGPAPRHRGFDYGELSPQEINHNGSLARTGGTKDGIFTTELSVPVQGTTDGIRLIYFVDVGDVWAQAASVRYQDLRTAYGIGLRFPPSIPVALDFAFLVHPGENESRTHVQVGLGSIQF